MPPVPSACQPLADQASSLQQQYSTLAAQVPALVGAPAWAALAQLGMLLQQLTSARDELAQCVKTHSAALTGSVVVIDASGAAPTGQQSVTLWDLAAGGAVAREVSPVQGGAFGFQGPLPARAAMTVQSAGIAEVLGLDFRSGALAGPLEGQTPRVEIVVGPQITLPARLLVDWAASFKPVSQTGLGVGGARGVDATISALSVSVAAGVITVTAVGVVSGPLLALLGGQVPLSGSVSVAIVPANDPQTDDVVSVTLAGPNPVSISTAVGPNLVGVLASALAPFLGGLIQNGLNVFANQALAGAVAAGLAIAQLPAGTRISLRSITVDETGISFQPALGLIGTALSTFQPSPLPLPPGA
jgi:hypothetical protein